MKNINKTHRKNCKIFNNNNLNILFLIVVNIFAKVNDKVPTMIFKFVSKRTRELHFYYFKSIYRSWICGDNEVKTTKYKITDYYYSKFVIVMLIMLSPRSMLQIFISF